MLDSKEGSFAKVWGLQPTSLVTSLYKVIAKVLASRLKEVLGSRLGREMDLEQMIEGEKGVEQMMIVLRIQLANLIGSSVVCKDIPERSCNWFLSFG